MEKTRRDLEPCPWSLALSVATDLTSATVTDVDPSVEPFPWSLDLSLATDLTSATVTDVDPSVETCSWCLDASVATCPWLLDQYLLSSYRRAVTVALGGLTLMSL